MIIEVVEHLHAEPPPVGIFVLERAEHVNLESGAFPILHHVLDDLQCDTAIAPGEAMKPFRSEPR